MKTHQSKIEKLIAELCPNGVEWKTLGEVAEIGTGSSNANEAVENGKYPLFVRSKFVKSINTFEFDEEAILIPGEGGVGDIFHYINGKYALHQRAYRIHFSSKEINTKFVYFYLFANFKSFITRYAVNATVSSIRKPMIKKFKIPIPPLPIQKEIVRILDKFTELIAELTTELTNELTARKKQYSYYRDKLLTFKEGEVEWKTLGEVINLKRGKRLVKSQLEKSGYYAVYQNSMKPLGYYHKSNVKSDTAFIICAGAAGEIGYSDTDFWAADDVYICLNTENLLSKFLYYCLLNQQNKILSQVRRASIPRLSKTAVEKLKIPIPYNKDIKKSLAEQARIVSILDKFDTLTHSISEGLPREIALRQKQYEYYREKLLNFPQFPSSGGVAGEA